MTVKRLTNPVSEITAPVAGLLKAAARAQDADLERRLGERGITDVRAAHCPVFEVIDPEGTRLTELAKRAAQTKQGMGELVRHLERHGYVRVGQDPTDGRAKLVKLTDKGWDVMKVGLDANSAREQAVAERLGERRLAQLRRTLEELSAPDPT